MFSLLLLLLGVPDYSFYLPQALLPPVCLPFGAGFSTGAPNLLPVARGPDRGGQCNTDEAGNGDSDSTSQKAMDCGRCVKSSSAFPPDPSPPACLLREVLDSRVTSHHPEVCGKGKEFLHGRPPPPPQASSHGGQCLRHQLREAALHCSFYGGRSSEHTPGQARQGQHRPSPSPKYPRTQCPGPGHGSDVSRITLAVDITLPPMGVLLFSHRLSLSLDASLTPYIFCLS